ncbi:hypothetical protein BN2476_240235 [Paraburkholderia piptadeniae]|uniref:Uncharacterized protein n=1 Tax=Paraburkholderia piptadeniae TaxID=1701573 RepID=A0A1N7RZK0_9BURK|nr:hypothetical protein BN2476_240235 [Paraburkholderia piptadeniae]
MIASVQAGASIGLWVTGETDAAPRVMRRGARRGDVEWFSANGADRCSAAAGSVPMPHPFPPAMPVEAAQHPVAKRVIAPPLMR